MIVTIYVGKFANKYVETNLVSPIIAVGLSAVAAEQLMTHAENWMKTKGGGKD